MEEGYDDKMDEDDMLALEYEAEYDEKNNYVPLSTKGYIMKSNKLIVEFDGDNGVVFPDNESQKYVDSVIANKETTTQVVIGSSLLVALFRCAVVENKIKHNDLKFIFKEKIIDVDKYGSCRKWPEGFGDADIKALERLLRMPK